MSQRFLYPLLDQAGYPCLNCSGDVGSGISCGSDASLDDLPAADFTTEGWVKIRTETELLPKIHNKTNGTFTDGWELMTNLSNMDLNAYCFFDTTDAFTSTSNNSLVANQWTHIALVWDSATKTFSIYINGVVDNDSQTAGVGVYQVDAANGFNIGFIPNKRELAGWLGWQRISDNKRYTAGFTPPKRYPPPAVDGNTIEQWNMDDMGGSTAAAEVSGNNDGTIHEATWDRQ